MAKKKRVVKRKVNPVLKRGKWITAKVRVTKNGVIEARVPRSAVKNPFDGVVLHRSTNPLRQWDVRVPPTMDLGSYRYGPVTKTQAEAKRIALQDYNSSRRSEGLSSLKSLPRGTTVREYSR